MDLHTRKSDKRNHGFGLSSVKQIVENTMETSGGSQKKKVLH